MYNGRASYDTVVGDNTHHTLPLTFYFTSTICEDKIMLKKITLLRLYLVFLNLHFILSNIN
jgi:hypothetical protein